MNSLIRVWKSISQYQIEFMFLTFIYSDINLVNLLFLIISHQIASLCYLDMFEKLLLHLQTCVNSYVVSSG